MAVGMVHGFRDGHCSPLFLGFCRTFWLHSGTCNSVAVSLHCLHLKLWINCSLSICHWGVWNYPVHRVEKMQNKYHKINTSKWFWIVTLFCKRRCICLHPGIEVRQDAPSIFSNNQCQAEKKSTKELDSQRKWTKFNFSPAAQAVCHIKPRLIMRWAPMSLLFRPDEAPSI